MMNNKSGHTISVVLIALLLSGFVASGQGLKEDKKQEKRTQIENLVASKSYAFIAQTAFPTGGRTINLTSVYSVKISGDTVVSDLPYYGRAYVAPIDPMDGGIHFTSTRFAYDSKERKKGGWEITILPKDTKDVRQMYLTISPDGYASLQVGSNNRQNINFSGYITSGNKAR